MNRERPCAWWPRLVGGSLVAVLISATGCIAETEPSGDSGSEPTGDSGSEGSDASATSTGGETGASETGAVQIPWTNIECGQVTCLDGYVCIQPGYECDTSPCEKGEEPYFGRDQPFCVPFPAHCNPANPQSCLEDEHCETRGELPEFVDGVMYCPGALDCHCF